MRHLLIGLMLLGCQRLTPDQQMAAQKDHLTKWGRYLIDCPTAQVTMTSRSEDGFTFFITGCGLKVCCAGTSCFSCIKKDWY